MVLADGVRYSQPVKRRGSAGGSAGDRGRAQRQFVQQKTLLRATLLAGTGGGWKHGAGLVEAWNMAGRSLDLQRNATLACNTMRTVGHLPYRVGIFGSMRAFPLATCWLLVSAPALQRKCRIPEDVATATHPKAPSDFEI